MMQGEKERLVALFADRRRWCQQAEARNAAGKPVCYYDEDATAWDLVGGMYRLFGPERAHRLFPHVRRNVDRAKRLDTNSRDRRTAAMSALLDFNDERDTTHAILMARLREMPVYYRDRMPAGG